MKTLALFFTYGVSLQDWRKNGTFEREISIYTHHLEYFDQIYFVTYGKKDALHQEDLPQGIKILPKKFSLPNPLYSLLIPIFYHKELRSCNWIKTNQMLGSWSAIIAKWIFQKKLVVRTGYTESLFLWNKSFLQRSLVKIIERLAYTTADISIVTSEHQKKYLVKAYDAKNISIIPNGVDTKLFSCLREDFPMPTKILFVGRIHPEKNILNLIQALSFFPGVSLTIVGSGPLEKNVCALAKKQSLSLTIIPSVPNSLLPKIYQEAELYVQPSLYEGNPKTIIEAMSCGLPVVATNIEGIRDVITHKQTGYLCTPEVLSIRKAIEEVRNDAKLRSQLSKGARLFTQEHYDIIKLIQKELSLYV